MQLVQTLADLRNLLAPLPDQTLGLVPTMGALHEGHMSLIRRCRQECDYAVVSIFVNPLQFGPQEDYSRYPRNLEKDSQLCQEAEVDLVFAPAAEEVIPGLATASTRVLPPQPLLQHLCAPYRPDHFAGVATIVTQLFHLVQPQRAYFGQKDIQQLVIIRQLVQDLHVPVKIIGCATVREADGLALSSRNRYLSTRERQAATSLYRSLQKAQSRVMAGKTSAASILTAAHKILAAEPQVQVQYLELADPQTLQPLEELKTEGILAVAAYVGNTRLIDNVLLVHPQQPSGTQAEDHSFRSPLIAIDGPAGAGKSTVARRVAAELDLLYLDTGAMYRAITWLALEEGIPLQDEAQLAQLAADMDLRLETRALQSLDQPTRVWVNGQEVTEQIRSQRVTENVSRVSALAGVRQALVEQQRALGQEGGVVLEGRDIGTQVFPDAELKIFLTASSSKRAERRQQELAERGELISLEVLEEQIKARDRYDSERPISPLQQATDAIVINTDNLTRMEVQAQIVELYRRLPLSDRGRVATQTTNSPPEPQ
ncbi:MAG: bifunctional pantoate--beta-alanine ligase/(d)CMP kinase [Synechococcaceae cyanobacterium SM2_3_1]|nr:bifunctional pantoate--beta-alanine ligase/(d)CMP kinase [Synechococcaceae cyanobacterium SM2_3_1]